MLRVKSGETIDKLVETMCKDCYQKGYQAGLDRKNEEREEEWNPVCWDRIYQAGKLKPLLRTGIESRIIR